MENTIYAIFRTPNEADQVRLDLVQQGATAEDVVLITKRTYRDPAFDADDNRLDLPEPIRLELDLPTATMGSFEKLPMRTDPIGNTPGEVWLADNMRFPGDLAAHLKELGFARDTAHEMETTVLDGGAILILRVPSGAVDLSRGSQVMGSRKGRILAPLETSPYLG